MMPKSMSAQKRIKGGWILDRVAAMSIHNEGDLAEVISSLRSTRTYIAEFDFIAPRNLNKRIVRIDARKDLGVTSWGVNNEILGLTPNSLATRSKIRAGWVLLAINGQPLPRGSSPDALLTALRQRADDRTDPFSRSTVARYSELTFNVASDDIRQVLLDPRKPGITWKVISQADDKHGCSSRGGIIVESVEDAKRSPRPGWRLVKIRANDKEDVPEKLSSLLVILAAAAKSGQNEVEATFDCSDEEPDSEGASDLQADAELRETQISPNDLPELPVVEPSIFQHIVGGYDFHVGGRALYASFGVCAQIARYHIISYIQLVSSIGMCPLVRSRDRPHRSRGLGQTWPASLATRC